MGAQTRKETREHVAQWLKEERQAHADVKYAGDTVGRNDGEKAMQEEGYSEWWSGFVGNYLKRAEILGLKNPSGRQALGKAITTLTNCLETAVEVYGSLPKPGEPSGQIRPWRERS